MGEKLIVGPINKGLKTNLTPFNIDNDSFPTLINAYQWRGRVKRKRGTSLLTRLKRQQISITIGNTDGDGNFQSVLKVLMGLQINSSIVPGTFTAIVGGITFKEPNPTNGTLLANNVPAAPGTFINYATTQIGLVTGLPATPVIVTFFYYPMLPVMGLEDFLTKSVQFPGTLGFDTTYSYNIVTSFPYPSYDVSFYKNPPTGTPATYVAKSTWTPLTWNGQDYQQFWTTNYQGALWATNGINVPFSITNIGMQYARSIDITYIANTATTLTVTIAGSPLVIGDFVFANEWKGANASSVNFQTGYVTQIAPNIIITFPNATLGAGPFTPGILQYLTNRSDTTVDCIRWYDGDPTDGFVSGPTPSSSKGWVNFMPPLSQDNFSIADLPAAKYYLVGARMILPFKDRLLFFGPVVQTSAAGSQVYLQDTVIYSQNGTPYYTASFTYSASSPTDPTLADITFFPLLVPDNQTATASAWFEDSAGFGGFISAGVDQPLLTVSSNGDVLITGFTSLQARLAYTGSDYFPFQFYLINSELGSGSTFSAINMDRGVITRGSRGYILTSQTNVDRIDLEIPDQVFQIRLKDNGTERFCSQRDYINEWIYFTYTSNQVSKIFPNQTLQYNYRDDSWAIFNESYTTYGLFRKNTGFTWQTVGTVYPTWSAWSVPWNAGSSTLLQPKVIAGNQQGFVITRDDGLNEANSLEIQSFSGNTVTSPNHNLSTGDYIVIDDAIGTIGTEVNGKIFSVMNSTTNTFQLNPTIGSGTYLGSGLIKKMYVPFVQTKQFPAAWAMSKKTRIGVQQYLLTRTLNAQMTLLIYLSQNNSSPYNAGPVVPDPLSINNSLIYSTVLYTSPESTNLGLTPANINLNTPTASEQDQIWHRINTSLIGDTIQLGFTMSDAQMRHMDPSGIPANITNITQATQAVFTAVNTFRVNQLVTITDVVGMIELNNNTYIVTAASATSFTLNVDSTGFTPYISSGLAEREVFVNQFAEIELHGFILDITPSQLLA